MLAALRVMVQVILEKRVPSVASGHDDVIKGSRKVKTNASCRCRQLILIGSCELLHTDP